MNLAASSRVSAPARTAFSIFALHDARGDPCRVGEGLSAKHRRGCAGRAGHDREQVAHPIEDHDCDAMRCAEAQGLDAHETAPAGHHDGCGHPRARVVSEAALAVMDKERAALDGEAGVVGLHRDDARLDRKARAPESVGLQRPRRRRWHAERAGRPASAHATGRAADVFAGRSQTMPARMAGQPSSVVLVGSERRCFAFADRSDDRRRVEWITSWTTHGAAPSVFS